MTERIRTGLVDLVAINLAWTIYYWFRIKSGWMTCIGEPEFWTPMCAIGLFWLLVYFFFGMYRSWYTKSRFDEFTTLFKASTFGVLFLFFAIFIDDRGIGSPLKSRLLITFYWALILLLVGSGRFLLHTIQRRLLQAGIGLRNTIIVGWSGKARELFDTVASYPALGHKVIGFVPVANDAEHSPYKGIPILGSINDIPQII